MKTVLSIDGGGIRGLIPALVLDKLEQLSGKPTHQLFDLIAGTSTGGILGLALTVRNQHHKARYRASELVKLYEERGKQIFERSLWQGVASIGGLTDQKYDHAGLESVLEEYLEEHPLGEALCRCMISTYDIHLRKPLFLKSWKPEHRKIRMRDAARATSAAPTYFEPAEVSIGNSMHALVDGGVFINSPSVSAFAEAQRLFPNEEILLVSLGTGELNRPIPISEARDWGQLEWLIPLLGCMFDGVADAADYQLKALLDKNYIRLQATLTYASDDMDNVRVENISNLKREASSLIRRNEEVIEKLAEKLSDNRRIATITEQSDEIYVPEDH